MAAADTVTLSVPECATVLMLYNQHAGSLTGTEVSLIKRIQRVHGDLEIISVLTKELLERHYER